MKKNKKEQKINEDLNLEKALIFFTDKLKKKCISPVMHKVYNMIYTRLLKISIFLNNEDNNKKRSVYENELNEILKLIKNNKKNIKEDCGWDIADKLKEFLIQIAPKEFLYQALVEEKCRNPNYYYPWEKGFGSISLDKHLEAFEKNKNAFSEKIISQQLLSLYTQRNDLGRHDRARERTRWRYLLSIAIILLVLIILIIGIVIFKYPELLKILLLVILSGATGAVLSRSLKLKKLGRIVDLQAAWRTLFPQTVFGMTLSLIVYIIISERIYELNEILNITEIYIPIIIGFISGFSEPFSLNIIGKITQLTKEQ